MMNLLHSDWFWVLIIAGPVASVIGILSRLARSGRDRPGLQQPADGAGSETPPSEQPPIIKEPK